MDPLYAFLFLGLFTPGPNVILLTASGARFGVRRTVPHILGVVVGVGVIGGLAGAGIGALLARLPVLELVLGSVAAGWILWMAWRLWQAEARGPGDAPLRPFRFWQAVLFQWVNPKVWAVAFAAASGYGLDLGPWAEAQRLALGFSLVNSGVCLFWSVAGSVLTYLLRTPQAWRWFSRVMALGLAASAAMVFL